MHFIEISSFKDAASVWPYVFSPKSISDRKIQYLYLKNFHNHIQFADCLNLLKSMNYLLKRKIALFTIN